MGFFSRTKKIVKPFVDVPRWLDTKGLADSTKFLANGIQSLFIPAHPAYQETFEEAMQRLKLTEQDIQHRIKEFYFLSWLYLFVSLVVYGYMIYLIVWQRSWLGALMCFSIAGVFLAHAFRKRFWYFQTKTRRLGYSFGEWFNADIKGRKNDKNLQIK